MLGPKVACHSSSFSQHLRVIHLLVTSGPRIDYPQRFALDACTIQKEFRKYYGKKVTKLICNTKNVTWNLKDRYKVLQRVRVVPEGLKKRFSRSLKHIEICNERLLGLKKFFFIPKIAQYKDLLSLDIYDFLLPDPSLYIQIKRLNHLRSLTLSSEASQIIDNYKHILSIKSLHTLRIKFLESKLKPNQIKALEFYSALMKSKHLEFLELNMKGSVPENDLIDSLLLEISQTKIPAFDINVVSFDTDRISRSLDAAINNIELFVFSFHSNAYFACNTSKNENLSLDQVKRRLGLEVVPDTAEGRRLLRFPTIERLSLNEVLLLNSRLQDLFIKDLSSSFHNMHVHSKLLTPNINSIAILKKLSLDFNKIREELLSEGKILASFLKDAYALEYLALKNISAEEEKSLESYQLIFAEINNLKNLTDLTLSFQYIIPKLFTISTQCLIYLKNLKRFLFNYSGYPSNFENLIFTFPEHSKLTEFQTQLPSLSSESRINFVRDLGKLRELEKFEARGGEQLLHDEKSKTLMMETLLGMTNLRKINFPDSFVLQKWEVDEQIKSRLAQEVRDFASRLFRENRDLEKLQIRKDRHYDIRYIRY